ncbi:hypothetical protein [Streptomyces sp. NBC_00470]|uniref:hypothetical protein n=1 Tax=Streptomyces sp. NBC_00470 TaxID=2975753 RepID=UPI002F9175AD
MARRTEYDEGQAARRLRVPGPVFRWARHAGLVPGPDHSSWQWSRAAVEAMDAGAVRASLPGVPLSGGVAADRIAEALGTPNPTVFGEKANVTSFVVRRLIERGLLTELCTNVERCGSMLHPAQVAEVCRRADLADLVAANVPLGPDQSAERLGVRRADFNWMLQLGWLVAAESTRARFGTSRAGAVDVALFTAASVDALPVAHPEVDWSALRAIEKGRRSPLAALARATSPV